MSISSQRSSTEDEACSTLAAAAAEQQRQHRTMSFDSDSDLSSSSSSSNSDDERHADKQSVSCSARPPPHLNRTSPSRGVHAPRSAHVHCRLLMCRVAGCLDFQCDDGIKGLCAAHSILKLPSSGALPRPPTAHKRFTVSVSRVAASHPADSSLSPSTSRSAHTAPSPLAPARHRRHKTFSSSARSSNRGQQESGCKLPSFGLRPMTVEALKAEGYEPFSQPAQQKQRRRSSRLSTSAAAAEPVFEPRTLPSSLSRALRTPAGLTLEREAKAGPRPSTAAARFVSCTTVTAARLQPASALPVSPSALPSSLSPPAPPSSAPLLSPSSPPARSSSPLSPPPAPAGLSSVSSSTPLLLSPALPPKRLKPLTPVEEQRLYRADLLSRLLQRPPVAPLPSDLLSRVNHLLARRPPVRVLITRQLLLLPQDDAERRRRRAEVKTKLALWLQRRAQQDALVRRNVLRGASVKHRSQELESWMRSRLSSKGVMPVPMRRRTVQAAATTALTDSGGRITPQYIS